MFKPYLLELSQFIVNCSVTVDYDVLNVLVPVPGELDQFELVTVCKLLFRVLIPRIVRDCGLLVGSIHLNVIDAFNCTLLVVDHGASALLVSLLDLLELLDPLLEPVLEL